MNKKVSLLILSMLGLLFASILSAFSTAPSSAQLPTATPDFELSATAIVARATLTAQAGGDMTSIGTSTPFASGLCNALTYRRLTDIEAFLTTRIINNDIPNTTVEALLLEETLDCITFTTQELTITLTTPLTTLREIHDEDALGLLVNRMINALLFAQSPLDGLSDPTMVFIFSYGNQMRTFSVKWVSAKGIAIAGFTGEAFITQVTLADIEGD